MHAGIDAATTADHVATENQVVLDWQHRQKVQKRGVASVDITDHPVA